MNLPDDTIAAISTPMGQGGIGIVRLSGPRALQIAHSVFRPGSGRSVADSSTFTLACGHVIDAEGRPVDEAVCSVMRGPRSYTREDVAEINCHGGPVAVRTVLELVLASGARLAEPGEFTKRAFLNGRISLSQAEAVMDLISARTGEGMRIAAEQLRGGLSRRLTLIRESLLNEVSRMEADIDFPEEEIETAMKQEVIGRLGHLKADLERLARTFDEARFFREGLSVAIVGRPNVGKSSLLNALLQKDRAIVTDIPGTTRDIIEEQIDIGGLPVVIVDTAGIRHSDETVEREGIRRSLEAMDRADFVVVVLDGSEPMHESDHLILGKTSGRKGLVAVNKSDLPGRISTEEAAGSGLPVLFISAASGSGLEGLKQTIFDANVGSGKEDREGVVVTNIRHRTAIYAAACSLGRAAEGMLGDAPPEIVSIELREALDRIGEITGAVTTEEILDKIFSSFCIGK